MESKFTILVDMDDTIEDLLVEWLHILNKSYRRCVTPDDVHSWDLKEAYPGLNDEQIFQPLFTDALWSGIKPKWDAVEYLRTLWDEGYNIYIVTSSNFKTIDTKISEILARYFPFIPMDHVIVCTNKQMIRGDVMVDDATHNLIGGDYEKILFTAPHNRDFQAEAHGMFRVSNWKEVYTIIHELS